MKLTPGYAAKSNQSFDSDSRVELERVAGAMDKHFRTLLLSVFFFFLALLTFSAYSIWSSVFVTKSFTARFVFFILSSISIMLTILWVLHWNRQFS